MFSSDIQRGEHTLFSVELTNFLRWYKSDDASNCYDWYLWTEATVLFYRFRFLSVFLGTSDKWALENEQA